MATFWLRDFQEVPRVRQQVRALAETLDALDTWAVEQVVGELAANCVEHRSQPGSAEQRGRPAPDEHRVDLPPDKRRT